MEMKEIIQFLFQYGGTVIMAGLFVWVFVQDKTKNNKLQEDNNIMLKLLTQSNNNIAKSLDIITNNLITMDNKIDRNYEAELKKQGE